MGFYSNLEKKWYKFVEGMDKKGIPIRAITDPIETAGLPSLPVIVGILLVLVALVAFIAIPAPGATLSIKVTSGGSAVEGAQVAAMFGTKTVSASTASDGNAELKLPLNTEVELNIGKEDCVNDSEFITLTEDDSLDVSLSCRVSPPFAGGACLSAAENLDQAALVTPDGSYPRNCRVSVKDRDGNAKDLGWMVSGKKLFMAYDAANCPQEGQRVEISCNDYEYSTTMSRFVQDVQEDYQVMLEATGGDAYQSNEAQSVYSTTVTVTDESGSRLSGIRVSATDASGNVLSLGYSNIMLQATTGSDGIATLVLPSGQQYYVKAEDTGVTYATKISPSYIANDDKQITLALKAGFDSTITVLNARDNSPIVNAYMEIYEGSTEVAYGYTGDDGKATFALEKKSYTAKVSMGNYMPVEVSFEGGSTSAQAQLEPLDDENSGFVEVLVKNAHGIGEPLEDVTVKLLQGDKEIKTAVTGTDGVASFGRIVTGSYTATTSEEGSDTASITVAAGEAATATIEVIPPQVKLAVLTEVEGEPNKGVDVEVYDITYSTRFPELVGSDTSGNNRKAEFSYDRGSVVYIKASFISPTTGEQFGPVVSEPIELGNDTEFTIDVTGVKNNVSMKILDENKNEYTGALKEGGNYYAELELGLPYYDPQTREPYSSVYLEMFTGGIGELGDIGATPIIIREVSLNDFVVEDPAVGALTTADAFVYNQEPFPDSVGASKYLKLSIASYKDAGTYRVLVPIHVRSAVKAENSQISYRAFWTSPEGSEFATNGGKWQHVPVSIDTQTSGWRFIESNPYFYLYDAWLSTDRSGNNRIGDWSIKNFNDSYILAEGSTFYLQFRGKAKVPSNNYYIGISTMPEQGFPYAIPISYSGSIVRTNGVTQEIFPVTSIGDSGKISPPSASPGNDYSVDADDEVQLAIRMKTRLKESGGISDRYHAQITVLGDSARQDLLFNIRDLKPAEETPVSNVIASEVVGSFIYSEPRIYDHTSEVVPSYEVPEYGPTYGKTFGAILNFKNSDTANGKSLTFFAQDEHRTKGNQQPWAKFYKQVLPVQIGGELEGWGTMNITKGDKVFLLEKQGYIWGTTLATSCDNLTITAEGGESYNCTVADNGFIFDYVPTETGWHTITVSMDMPMMDGAEKTFEDTLDVYVADLPEMDVAVSAQSPVTEGNMLNISTTITNNDTNNPVTILNYSSLYNYNNGGNNTLEPRAYITIDGTPYKEFAAIPPIEPDSSDSSVAFSWEAAGSGPKNVTVCAGYYKYDGSNWNLILNTESCDSKPVTIEPKKNDTLQDLGMAVALNFTSAYKGDASAVDITGTVTNHDVSNDTNSAYTIGPLYWITNENGYRVAGGNMPEIKSIANNSENSTSLIRNIEDLDVGAYTVTACAYYLEGGAYYQDSDDHANCNSTQFTLMARPATSAYAGSGSYFEQLGGGTGGAAAGSAVNIRELVENGQYDEALKQLLIINRTDEPTEEKLEYSWSLPANGSDWTVMIGKGVLAEGSNNILNKASKLEIYLFESDADRAGLTPWEQGSFKHGWVDYDISLKGYDTSNNERLDTSTAVLVANVIRKDAENKDGKALGIGATYTSEIKANGSAVAGIENSDYGYSGDIDDSYLLIPFSNNRNEYIRYLPTETHGALKPGVIELHAEGLRFVVDRNYTVGGIDVTNTGTTFDFTSNPGSAKTSTITIANHWDHDITIGELGWNPARVQPIYNLLVTKDWSKDKNGVPGDASVIKPEGTAQITVTGSPASDCYGEREGWLEIPISGMSEPYTLRFILLCSTAGGVSLGDQAVFRETASPSDINTGGKRGCEITKLDDGRKRVSVCDAEQFTMALLRDAAAGKTQETYALGAESLTADTMEKIRQAYGFTGIHDVFLGDNGEDTGQKQIRLVNNNISCGAVVVNFETIEGSDGQDVKVTPVTLNSNAEWCGDGYAAAIGYMNLDEKLRSSYPGGVKAAAFRSGDGFGMGSFLADLQKAIDRGYMTPGVELQHVFGYDSDRLTNDYDTRDYSIDYRDYYQGELNNISDWDWLTDQMGDGSVMGYLDIVDGPGIIGKTVRFGIAYSDSTYRDDPELLSGDRQQLAVDVVKYITENNSAFISGNSHQAWSLTLAGKPTANAGEDMYVDISETPTITLDGSGSTDPNGQVVEYIWNIKRGAKAEAEEYVESQDVTIVYDNSASGKFQIEATGANAYAKYFVYIPVEGAYSVSLDGWDVTVDGQGFSSGQLSKGTHTVEITNNTASSTADTITFTPAGAGEKVETNSPTKSYRLPGPGEYTVTLKVRDDDGIESDSDSMTIYATESYGADLQIGDATRDSSVVFDVNVPVTNNGGADGSAVVSLWTVSSIPTSYTCDEIMGSGSYVRAMPVSLAPGGEKDVSLQTTESSAYLVAVVSGSGSRLTSCDRSISSKWIDYASVGRGASDDATTNTNASVDDSYIGDASSCNAKDNGCNITIDLRKIVTGIQEIDTYLAGDDCRIYEGYILQASSDGSNWQTLVDKGRVSGAQADTFDPTTMQYIRYQFKNGGDNVDHKGAITEVDAYQELTGRSGAGGDCGDVCFDADGDHYGVDLNGWACAGKDVDSSGADAEGDACTPDNNAQTCLDAFGIGIANVDDAEVTQNTKITLTYTTEPSTGSDLSGTINWGDGNTDTITVGGESPTHTYNSANTYYITFDLEYNNSAKKEGIDGPQVVVHPLQ